MNKILENENLCLKVISKYQEAQAALVDIMNELCELPESKINKAIKELEKITKYLKTK